MSEHEQTTQLMNRRRALLTGASGLAAAYAIPKWLLGGSESIAEASESVSAAADCVLTPELTEGPYYVDDALFRRNVTEGKSGMPLILRLSVVDASTCKAISGATVEIWHADAAGEYSAFDGSSKTTHYLRGQQKTNSNGVASFVTIFPGWYSGRAPHIHVKVHVGGSVVHTGQIFFRPATIAKIYSTSPYNKRTGSRTTNGQDNIYAQGGSKSLLKTVKRDGKRGYAGYLTMGVS
jgi:protocatechuate 3,4-dioxygenase beta subunit